MKPVTETCDVLTLRDMETYLYKRKEYWESFIALFVTADALEPRIMYDALRTLYSFTK
jgi:hypothetical protein